MAYSFCQDLFKVDGVALCFDVSSCYDADELESIIEFGGGRTDNRGGPHTITFLTRNSKSDIRFYPHRDVYSSDFILKCCIRNTILPLKNFLLNESMFTNDFNPNDILLHKITWEDAQQHLAHPVIADVKTFKNPPGCLKIGGVVPVIQLEIMKSIPDSTHTKRLHRHEFTQNDRQKIIDFIVSNQNFDPSDPNYWRKMAEGFSVHTWQSLKGHFRNKVYPSITQYKLSDEIIRKIRTQMETKKRYYKDLKERSDNDNHHDHVDDDTENLPGKKSVHETPEIVNLESCDESLIGSDGTLFNNKLGKEMRKKRSCKSEELSAYVDQDQCSDQSSVSFSSFIKETPSEEEEPETENGTSQPEELITNVNNNQDHCSNQSSELSSSCIKEVPTQEKEPAMGMCRPEEFSTCNPNESSNESFVLSSNFMKEIPFQEEEHAHEMKTMQDVCVQWDCDEHTVSDNFAQTDAVEILPLPDGWDYPTTFAGALQLMRSAVTIKNLGVQRKNEKPLSIIDATQTEDLTDPCPPPPIGVIETEYCEVSTTEKSFKGTVLTGKSPSKSSPKSPKLSPSKLESVRRSTRHSPLSRPKKTRSGWPF